METVSSLGVDFGADTSRYMQASRQVSVSLDGLAGQAVRMGAALAGAFAASGAIAGAMQLDKTLANIRAVSGASAAEMGNLRKELSAIGGSSTVGVQATADAFYDIASGVTDASVRMAVLNAAVATAEAGQASLTAVTRGLINVTNAYGGSAQDVTKYSDILTRTVGLGVGTMDEFVGALGPVSGLAANVGISFKDLGTMMAFLTTQGMTASQAATELQGDIVALLKPNEAMKKALKGIGAESGSAAIKMYSLAGTLGKLQKSIGSADGMTEALGRVEAAIGAIGLNKPEFEAFIETFENGMTGATEAARGLQLESISAQFEVFKNRVGAVALDIGTGLLTGLSRVPTIIDELWKSNVLGIPQALEGAYNATLPQITNLKNAFAGLFADIGAAFSGSTVTSKFDVKAVADFTPAADIMRGQNAITAGTAADNFDLAGEITSKVKPGNIGAKLAAALSKWLPEIKTAIEGFGASFRQYLIDGLNIDPKLINIVENISQLILSPLSDAFGRLANINWSNVGLVGGVLLSMAGGIGLLGMALNLIKTAIIFDAIIRGLEQISQAVDVVKTGDLGKALRDHLAPGIAFLGVAFALMNMNTLTALVGQLIAMSAPAVATGIVALAGAIGAMIGPILLLGGALTVIGLVVTSIKGVFEGLGKIFDLWVEFRNRTVKDMRQFLLDVIATLSSIADLPFIAGGGVIKASLNNMKAAVATMDAGISQKATGGWVGQGTTYLVGEKGPELFSPSRSGYITPNDQLGAGGGPIQVQLVLDGRQIYEAVLNQRDIRNRRGW